jgi:chaperone required for assembly of F1-ATPase
MAASRRFYSEVSVADRDDGFAVLLDGKLLHTPARAPVVLPAAPLAEAVAEEWRAQGETLDPAALRLTRLANTAIDRIRPDPAPLVEQVVGYGACDLLCYRVAAPHALVERQAAAWQPMLDWASARYGIRFTISSDLFPITPDESALAALRAAVARYDAFALAGLGEAVGVLGSLVLALALADRRIDGSEAFALSRVEEQFQIEQWGEDREARGRADRLLVDLLAAERLLRLAEGGSGPAGS